MDRLRLTALQVLVAVVSIALWHVLTTIPVGDKPLLPPFFFSTPLDVAARVVKWFAEGTIWRHLWITLGRRSQEMPGRCVTLCQRRRA